MNNETDDRLPLTSFNISPSEVLESSFDSIFVKLLPDLNAIYINKEPTERMFGYPVEVFYQGKFQCVHPQDRPIYFKMVDECLSQGMSSTKLRCLRKDGSVIWALYKMRAIRNDEGNPFAIMGSCIDITELVKLEQNMIFSSRLASMGEISNGLAHEINNPLMIISASLNCLKRFFSTKATKLDETNALKKIENSVDRIASIINGLKNFSKDPSSELLSEISLQEIVDEVFKYTYGRFQAAGINFKVEMGGPEEYSIVAKKYQITHALINLLNNAYDAVSNCEPKWVNLIIEKINNSISFSVIDSGPGVKRENVHKIMEPFFTTKEIGKGVGLGLSISKGIAEEHSGSLTYVDNAKNTHFNLVIPIKR